MRKEKFHHNVHKIKSKHERSKGKEMIVMIMHKESSSTHPHHYSLPPFLLSLHNISTFLFLLAVDATRGNFLPYLLFFSKKKYIYVHGIKEHTFLNVFFLKMWSFYEKPTCEFKCFCIKHFLHLRYSKETNTIELLKMSALLS